MADKNCIVVEHAVSPYRVRRFNGKGDVVEEYQCPSKYSALNQAYDINDKFLNVIERDW